MEVKMKKVVLFITLSLLMSAQMIAGVINVPALRQNGQTWSSQTLGTCTGCTVGSDGCAVTCVAMLMKTNGVNIDPDGLNQYLKNSSGYDYNSSGCPGYCLIKWDVPVKYAGCNMTYSSLSTTFSLGTVKSEIDNGNPVILQTKVGSSLHFVVIKGYNGSGASASDYVVVDPLKTGDQILTNYSTDGIRIYRNVSQQTSATCTFNVSVESAAQTALSQGWKFWQMTNSNFYHIYGTVSNLSVGSNYAIWLANESGTPLAQIMGNQSASSFDFALQANSPYNDGSKYTFLLCPQGVNTTIWTKSPWFYMSALPTLSISVTPTLLSVGQQATVNWSVDGGITSLSDGGWTNNIQLQWYQNNAALTNLAMTPVANHTYSFTVPATISGASVPGCQFKISGSNPDNSSIKAGYVSKFSNEFCVDNGSAVKETSAKGLIVYPTLTRDKITVECGELTNQCVLTITTLNGREVLTQRLTNSKTQIDLRRLTNGAYLVKLQNGKSVQVKSIVKK